MTATGGHMDAKKIFAAVMRAQCDHGFACLPEFTLKTNRRADIICLNKQGVIHIIEVKSSLADFRADTKWQDYIDWADAFFFAVGDDFPLDVLPGPEKCGIIITDGFDCHWQRQAPDTPLKGARRNHLTRRIARTAMMRHYHLSLDDQT